MALSNLNKNTITNLFRMLSLNETDLSSIKSNYSSYGQLIIIAEQMYNLQKKAEQIINNSNINTHLHSLEMSAKKIPGKIYYHYKNSEKEYLSIISPEEWGDREDEIFLNKYIYELDNIFYKID